jgi:dihydrofolate reductase
MAINIIVAMTEGRVIGDKGSIPWKIPEETKLFKELTTGNIVIMGRNTWDSLPPKFRPLPNRTNIVISTTMQEQAEVIVCKTIKEAMQKTHNYQGEVFCIGGAQIYSAMLPMADTLHISKIKKSYSGDTYFPEIKPDEWDLKETKEFTDFTYKKYARKD